jgi:hypothetical protein
MPEKTCHEIFMAKQLLSEMVGIEMIGLSQAALNRGYLPFTAAENVPQANLSCSPEGPRIRLRKE